MHLNELKSLPIKSLVDTALEMGIENASRLRKQELMFAILKRRAKAGESVFGDGTLEVLPDGFGFLRDAYFWVLLGLTLNTAAYSTIIFSGAINNTEYGEIEAGRAYGMSSFQVMRHIVLPSSLRRALPAYSNEVILMLQATALASSFTLFEITGQAVRFNSTHYQPFVAYIPAAIMYLIMTYILVLVFKALEKRYLAHLRPRSH